MKPIINAKLVLGGIPELVGLVIDADTNLIAGMIPGTPVTKLTAEQVSEMTGYAWDEEALRWFSMGITLPPGVTLPYGIPDMSWRSDLL